MAGAPSWIGDSAAPEARSHLPSGWSRPICSGLPPARPSAIGRIRTATVSPWASAAAVSLPARWAWSSDTRIGPMGGSAGGCHRAAILLDYFRQRVPAQRGGRPRTGAPVLRGRGPGQRYAQPRFSLARASYAWALRAATTGIPPARGHRHRFAETTASNSPPRAVPQDGDRCGRVLC